MNFYPYKITPFLESGEPLMNKRAWLPGSAGIAALAAGLLTFGSGGIAHADTTTGQNGVLSGNQISLPINLPISIQGTAVGVLGKAKAKSSGKTVARGAPHGKMKTSGKSGILSGNQISAPINLPINACGNSVAVLGSAGSKCRSSVRAGSGGKSHKGGAKTSGAGGIGSGNQVLAPVNAPVAVCGNAAGVLGTGKAKCKATVRASAGKTRGAKTSGAGGILGGNQVIAPINAPVGVCGNAVGNASTGPCKLSVAASSGSGAKAGKTDKTGKAGTTGKSSRPRGHIQAPVAPMPAAQSTSSKLPATGGHSGLLALIGALLVLGGGTAMTMGRYGRMRFPRAPLTAFAGRGGDAIALLQRHSSGKLRWAPRRGHRTR